MSSSREERNKSIVLDAFETLFNKRDYRMHRNSGRQNTFNTAPTSRPAVTVYFN